MITVDLDMILDVLMQRMHQQFIQASNLPETSNSTVSFPIIAEITIIYHFIFISHPQWYLHVQQQIYCMEDANKKTNHSFLEKFRGKTNKINKNGLNQALASNRTLNESAVLKDQNTKLRPVKLVSLDAKKLSQNYEQVKSEMDDSVSNNPERKYMLPMLKKRSTDISIRSNKLDPLPQASPLKEIKQSAVYEGFVLPPSRSISDKTQDLHRRAFGKYLKLDDQAMKHFQFLLQIDHKRNQRKSTAIFSQR